MKCFVWIVYTIYSVFNYIWHKGRQALESVVKNRYSISANEQQGGRTRADTILPVELVAIKTDTYFVSVPEKIWLSTGHLIALKSLWPCGLKVFRPSK